jgi:hypothetical protein
MAAVVARMAELAFDLAIDNPLPEAHHVLAPSLSVRATTGPVPG